MVSLLGFLYSLIYAKVGAHVAVISKTPKGIKKKKKSQKAAPSIQRTRRSRAVWQDRKVQLNTTENNSFLSHQQSSSGKLQLQPWPSRNQLLQPFPAACIREAWWGARALVLTGW